MAPTGGRFAMPERWWDCRRGTPSVAIQTWRPRWPSQTAAARNDAECVASIMKFDQLLLKNSTTLIINFRQVQYSETFHFAAPKCLNPTI